MTKSASKRISFVTAKWAERVRARAEHDHSVPQDAGIFDLLLEADPTLNKGYFDWICRIYSSGNILIEDRERVNNTLALFHRWKHKLPLQSRDIGRHDSEHSAWAAIEQFDPTRTEDDNHPEGRELRRIERAKALAESEIEDAEGLEGWVAASPRTHFASQWWGRGTRWCTSMKTDVHFHGYNKLGPLRVFIDPDGQKFQAHVATDSCNDARDAPIVFRKFVDRLPSAAVEILKRDASQFFEARFSENASVIRVDNADIVQTLLNIPPRLLDDRTAAVLRARGLERVCTLVEEDGWKFELVNDQISKWALGLFSEAHGRRALSNSHSLFLTAPGGSPRIRIELSSSASCDPVKEAGHLLLEAPASFRDAVLIAVTDMWEHPARNLNKAALGTLVVAVGWKNVPKAALLDMAHKISKKKREWYDLAIPHDFVDDDVADRLAEGSTLFALPLDKITKPRLKRILSRCPDLAGTEAKQLGLEQKIDHEIGMAMVGYKAGEGLQFVPEALKTREFCLEAVMAHPRAIAHVPEDYLTYHLCLDAVRRVGNLVEQIPLGYRDKEMYLASVSQYGALLNLVPDWLRGDEEICMTALAQSPDSFVHAVCPLPYEAFLRGVSVSGSLLARVPLPYRDAEMCLTAIAKQRDASMHVPPMVGRMLASDPANSQAMRWYKPKVSSRYPWNDPIHTFVPEAEGERPSMLPPLKVAQANSAMPPKLVTGPVTRQDTPEPEDESAGGMVFRW